MKKLIFLTLLISFVIGANAQDRSLWFDFEVGQSLGLNKWHNDPRINDAIRKPATTDFRVRMSWYFYEQWGGFIDAALSRWSFNSGNEGKLNFFDEIDLENYYIKDYWSRDNKSSKLGGNFTIGGFYKFDINKKWSLMPHLGIGFDQVNVPSLTYDLKEKGSNNMYTVNTTWFDNQDTSKPMSVLSLQVLSTYRLARHSHIVFGINYRRYLSRIKFSAEMADYYTGRVVNQINSSGNYMNTIGITIGVSFR